MSQGDGRISIGRHRRSGSTFKSRRAKRAMEREANKPKLQKHYPEMKSNIKDLWISLKSVGAP